MDKTYISAEDIKYQLANLRQLTLEVTDDCNLYCKYCGYGEFYNDYDNRQGKKMSLSAIIKLIDYLNELWKSSYNTSQQANVFISFYGGEPLLNMPFIESVVAYIEKLENPQRKFTFSMTTNGLLIKRYMEFLVKHNFMLLVSLDGNENNTSYRVNKHGKAAYPAIIENVNALKEQYPVFFEERVNFNAVLHNRNSISDIYHFFKTHYNKIPSIGELNNMGIRPDKVALFQQTYRNATQSMRQAENYEAIEQDMFIQTATYQSLTSFIHQHSGFVFRDYTDLFVEKPKHGQYIPTGTCIPFSRRMFITVNGKIMPCERIGQQFALGYVSEEGVDLDISAIAQKYNTYFAKLERQCNKCHNRSICIQCIFNLKDLEGTPVCYGFMNEQQFADYKERQMAFLRKHPEDYYRIMEEVIVE